MLFCGVDMGRPFFISCEIWGTANKVSEIIKDICGKIDIDNFSINPFSDGIENVCIVVNCHPDENLIRGWGKPRKYINYQKRYADIRLPIPYVEFISADYDHQYLMVLKNIVESIRVIGNKCKKSKKATFDSEELVKVILLKMEISEESLDEVIGVIPDEKYRDLKNGW